MKEFRVNEFITLKLEESRTNIYVKGERFRQCKYLAFSLDMNTPKQYDNIESIDDLEQKDRSEGFLELHIDSETEFWGHCSNLQAWAEHDYNTRILHRTIAFPLLKKLTKAGCKKAEKLFKEEIALRFSSGNWNIMEFLMEGGYLNYLNPQELDTTVSNLNIEKSKSDNLKNLFMIFIDFTASGSKKAAQLFQGEIKSCLISKNRNEMKFLDLSRSNLTTLSESIGNLRSLEKLSLERNKLTTLPESIGDLTSLKDLYLEGNNLKTLPESIGNLKSLEKLWLSNNKITTLPESIGDLTSLEDLFLSGNDLTTLPESITRLKSLEKLDLRGNKLTTLPESITKVKSLKKLNLRWNNLSTLPESIGNLTSLE
jgi:hypothetical protein